MKTIFFILSLLLFGAIQSRAQSNSRNYISHKMMDDWLTVDVSDGLYMFRAMNSKIMETHFIPKGEEFKRESHAVILQPKDVSTKLKEKNGIIRFETDGIAMEIQQKPFKISYDYQSKPLISEKAGYIKTDSLEKLQFNLTDSEVLFGGGARALGMNRRGNRLELYNKADYGYEERSELMNFTLPIVISSKIYAIHFDNAPIGFLDLDSKKDNTLQYETISGRKVYQVIAGEDWKDLIDQYTTLTGKQPLPPRWVFGNFASRFGYHSEEEAREVVTEFQKSEIPLEAIILDIYWFGKDIKGHMGNLEFLKDSFPTPQENDCRFQCGRSENNLDYRAFCADHFQKMGRSS